MPQFILSEIPEAVFEGRSMDTGKIMFSYPDQFSFGKLSNIKYYVDQLNNLLPKWRFKDNPSHYIRQTIERLLNMHDQIYQECIRVNRININLHERIDELKKLIIEKPAALIEQCEANIVDSDLNADPILVMESVLIDFNNRLPRPTDIRHPIYFARETLDKLIKHFIEFYPECVKLNESNIRLKIAEHVLSEQLDSLQLAEFAAIAAQELPGNSNSGTPQESPPPLEERSFATDDSPRTDTGVSAKKGKFSPGI